jgi:hypothetical protein
MVEYWARGLLNTLGFATSYHCEVVSGAELTGSTILRFAGSRHVGSFQPGLTLQVRTHRGSKWTGAFDGIHEFYHSGIYATPSPEHICVICHGRGYLVPVDTPTSYATRILPGPPIRGVARVPDRMILLVWDSGDLAAYNGTGLLWWIASLSPEEGIRLTDVSADTIHGESWDVIHNRPLPFSVNPLSGSLTGGWPGARVRTDRESYPPNVPSHAQGSSA